ncbi:RagB/SusD family nutrient uptake outer membrane protein [Pedobacter ginsengisoli]|uniref:RagB/SusD family nutrient uptake outer membrane protein n=1 Tax=Pedobacter ginsengisoli TaxID=363852 RepID=UPI0025512603|nr:RagB/SusD family nutrient uptake outer membrane protein [Pedobacter ginsengisoli]
MKSIFLKRTYLLFPIAFIFFCSLYGCKKAWLEAKVDQSQAVPSTVKDFQAMLDNVNNINITGGSFQEIAADGHYYTDAVWNTYKGRENENIYTWSNNNPYLGNLSNSYWSSDYKKIAITNVVLDELAKVNNESPQELANIKGQALFIRSMFFFFFAQVYAPAYEKEKAAELLGIPLRLSSDISIPSTRSSLKATYDRIILDLLMAKDLLPDNALFLSRASKNAVKGLLARTYLIMGDYTNALKYSNEYLQVKNRLLDFNIISASANFIGNNTEIEFVNLLPQFLADIRGNYLIEQNLLDLYNENDLRKTRYFRTSSAGIQFKGTYGSTASDLFCGIATDEIYLIRAECYARTGNLTLAMKDLNDLIRTRWAKNPDGSTKYVDRNATSETDALRIILEERKKEFILRNLRWSDLKRLNLDDRFKVTLSRTIGGTTYTLEPGSYRYAFPIPQDIIAMTGMQQNPGWP